jgi:hypothetical protein
MVISFVAEINLTHKLSASNEIKTLISPFIKIDFIPSICEIKVVE